MIASACIVTHSIVLPVIGTGVTQARVVGVIFRPNPQCHCQFNEFLYAALRPGICRNSRFDICGAHCSCTVSVIYLYFVATGQRGMAVINFQDFQVLCAPLRTAFPGVNGVRHKLAQFLFCHCFTSCLLAIKIQRPGGVVYAFSAGAVFSHDTISQASTVQRVQRYGFYCCRCHSGRRTSTALVFQISKVYQRRRVRNANFQPVFHIGCHVLFCQIVLGFLACVCHQQATDRCLFLGVHCAGVPVCGRCDLTIKGSPQNGSRPAFCRTDCFQKVQCPPAVPLDLPNAHGSVIVCIYGTVVAFLSKNNDLGRLHNLFFQFFIHLFSSFSFIENSYC